MYCQRTEREVKEYKARWTELGTISRGKFCCSSFVAK